MNGRFLFFFGWFSFATSLRCWLLVRQSNTLYTYGWIATPTFFIMLGFSSSVLSGGGGGGGGGTGPLCIAGDSRDATYLRTLSLNHIPDSL